MSQNDTIQNAKMMQAKSLSVNFVVKMIIAFGNKSNTSFNIMPSNCSTWWEKNRKNV